MMDDTGVRSEPTAVCRTKELTTVQTEQGKIEQGRKKRIEDEFIKRKRESCSPGRNENRPGEA